MADISTAPSFIERDGANIISEMVSLYEGLTGRTLHPAQAERLLINAFAYRELLLREQIQSVAVQMLVDFATAPAIDYLAQLVGVTRLSASGASTTLRFTFSSGHGGLVLPANLRVASSDGQVVFKTLENVNIEASDTTKDVEVFSNTLGTGGNSYSIGTITKILDPQPFLTAASNLTATTGGADEETDDALRERIKLAPAQFSVAGSRDAYIFFAKSASPAIIDVEVVSSVPGTVNIYPLISGGIETPTEILNLVLATCNGQKVRPLTDTVIVESPAVVDYDIDVDIVIYTDGDSDLIKATIETVLAAYADERAARLGVDVKLSQIIAEAMYDTDLIFDVTVNSPAADVEIDFNEVAVVGTITVTIESETDG